MKKNKTQQPKQIYLNRVKCDCVAQKHALINNCLGCGKVVCAQQGQGPCLYCGHIVTRPDGRFIVNDQSLFPALDKQQINKISQERSKAIGHKNVLLERDKSTNPAQNIYDESIDYYDISQNQWLDEESRQNAVDKLLAKQKFVQKQKLKHKVYFDPLTGQFVSQAFSFDETSFKEESKNFLIEKEKEEYTKKINKANENWDKRLENNEKVKQIVAQLKQQTSKKGKAAKPIEVKNKVTQLIIEEEETNGQKEKDNI